ncbi:MAG: enolase-phosphatase E1 [Candelina mexicana]|nr:MAG: enolase-phosphatase E1 [Candelina mexicana]
MKFEGVNVVLLDIEGTVCSITFVKDVLFPYTLKTLPQVVEQKWDHREFKSYRDAFPEGVRDDPQAFERHVRECTEKDVKVSYLKNLQVTGYLWQTLYSSGAIKTPIYPDVLPCLHSWYNKNILVAIYSSGSVSAQKLFFQHTDTTEGDLSQLIVEYFDTLNAGPKTDAQSYKNIANALKVDAERILFLSDSVKEMTAARDADMKSVLVVRAGNVPLSEVEKRDYANIESFNDLDLDTARS